MLGIVKLVLNGLDYYSTLEVVIRRKAVFMLLPVLLISSACTHQPVLSGSTSPAPATFQFEDHGLFGSQPDIIPSHQIFELSATQRDAFSAYLGKNKVEHMPPYKRVFNYLRQSTSQFSYHGQTYIAKDALRYGEGNCLSLAIVTTALARAAGVQISYQLVDSRPIFELGDNAVAKGVHVRTKLYRRGRPEAGDAVKLMLETDGIVVDYFPDGGARFLGNLTEKEFIARYYLNRAVDFLQQGSFEQAYWHTLESLKLAPGDADAINLLAVIHKQSGYLQIAEQLYLQGIATTEKQLTLLKNYRQLLTQQGRDSEANDIRTKIARYEDPSPYSWLLLASDVMQEGHLKDAISYYNKAIKLAPYLEHGYLGLARVYYQQGRLRKTEAMLNAARERAGSDEDSRYRAKLSALAAVQDKQ